ncbi:stalk domain-containing protein [Paenibacillus thailandensis]
MNEAVRAFCNVDEWHAAGYTGKGQKIGVVDKIGECIDPADFTGYSIVVPAIGKEAVKTGAKRGHLYRVLHSILAFGPDVEIHLLGGSPTEYLQYMIDNDLDIFSKSTTASWYNATNNGQEKRILSMGNVLITPTGNVSDGGLIDLARKHTFFSIGAARLVNGRPVVESYSCYDNQPAVDALFFSSLEIPDGEGGRMTTGSGTSFSAPAFAGLLACWRQSFFEQNGRKPTTTETNQFFANNCARISVADYDNQSGYGVFRLPAISNPEREDEPEREYSLLTVRVGSARGDLDGKPYALDAAPEISNGRVMLGMRDAVRAVGGDVLSWDNVTKTAVFKLPRKESP